MVVPGIDGRGKEVVRGGDGMDVASHVEVEVLLELGLAIWRLRLYNYGFVDCQYKP